MEASFAGAAAGVAAVVAAAGAFGEASVAGAIEAPWPVAEADGPAAPSGAALLHPTAARSDTLERAMSERARRRDIFTKVSSKARPSAEAPDPMSWPRVRFGQCYAARFGTFPRAAARNARARPC